METDTQMISQQYAQALPTQKQQPPAPSQPSTFV